MTNDQGELLAMQAGTAQRLAEVLVRQLRAARFDRAADLMAERERLETLADLLAIATTATRQMANGKPYAAAMIAALEAEGEA